MHLETFLRIGQAKWIKKKQKHITVLPKGHMCPLWTHRYIERQIDRETDRHRLTDRVTYRETQIKRDTQTEIKTDRHREIETERHREIQKKKQTQTHM